MYIYKYIYIYYRYKILKDKRVKITLVLVLTDRRELKVFDGLKGLFMFDQGRDNKWDGTINEVRRLQ